MKYANINGVKSKTDSVKAWSKISDIIGFVETVGNENRPDTCLLIMLFIIFSGRIVIL